ncbi:MAG: 2-oxoacid:acceptor oxidoreductase family protein [Candidatus Heimdallarchaeota archaeon]|nr:2-oxoacid:acceptor oxidoreductase family protein [Candidatus Heimdallarchaeota archaeon]MDH5644775.1 2-oxoacid:acceptor oxidoreductase family protein [Candidatus Heimdallarchaeota archaeon]
MKTEFRASGVGGQGIITMGHIIGKAAAIYDDKKVIMTEAYGPEITGGFAVADVIIDENNINYPIVDNPDILVILSSNRMEKDLQSVKTNGIVLFDSNFIEIQEIRESYIPIPAFETAIKLGNKVIANVIMLGALQVITEIISKQALETILFERVPKKFEELNKEALKIGYKIGMNYRRNNNE